MATRDPRTTQEKEWRLLYRKAIVETNKSAIAREVFDAEAAVAGRERELFQKTGVEVEVERDALNDAMYALEALKTSLDHTADAA